MQKVILKLAFNCYPMWIYNERNEIVDNDLVPELKHNIEVDSALCHLQNQFDSLFTNSSNEFSYNGFASSSEKKTFAQKIDKIYQYIQMLIGGKYIVVNLIDINKM